MYQFQMDIGMDLPKRKNGELRALKVWRDKGDQLMYFAKMVSE